MKRIGIIGGALAPYFNESSANQMYILSKELNARVVTCNDIGILPYKKFENYLIVNIKFILNRIPILSFINGIFLYIIIKIYERKLDLIIIPGGIESEFLKYLNLTKCIPIVTSIQPNQVDAIRSKLKSFSIKFPKIIVQSRKTQEQLIGMGIYKNVAVMYPLVDLSKFMYSNPPHLGVFKFLFASSPNLEILGEDNYDDKGVSLLLKAFSDLIKEENAILYIVWRGKYNRRLYEEIKDLDLHNYVYIINDCVDMSVIYREIHATVIPYKNLHRSPEIPLSALESLASGRPVVSTNVSEIAELIHRYNFGYVSVISTVEFSNALKKCMENYSIYQKNCKYAADILLRKNITFEL